MPIPLSVAELMIPLAITSNVLLMYICAEFDLSSSVCFL